MTFSDYIEMLASQHKEVRHREGECHYSFMAEDAQQSLSHMRMSFPCVLLDEADVDFTGSDSQTFQRDGYSLLFVDHVRDTGDADEVRRAFHRMRCVALDFLKRMVRDRNRVRILNRFSLVGVELERVYLESAGLYGYGTFLRHSVLFTDLDCNHAFRIEDGD